VPEGDGKEAATAIIIDCWREHEAAHASGATCDPDASNCSSPTGGHGEVFADLTQIDCMAPSKCNDDFDCENALRQYRRALLGNLALDGLIAGLTGAGLALP
jgi:hypothetical protein